MRTLKAIGKFVYNKHEKEVTEIWSDRKFCTNFPLSAYIGLLRRIIFRASYILATLHKPPMYK